VPSRSHDVSPTIVEAIPLPDGQLGAAWHHRFNGTWHPRHRHTELEANLVLQGQAVMQVGGRTITLGRHDLLWLGPTHDHHLVSQSADFRMWVLLWQPALIQTVLGHGERFNASPRLARLDPTAARSLASIASDLELVADPDLVNHGLHYLLGRCWQHSAGATDAAPQGDLHPAVAATLRLLRDGDEREIAVLAGQVGLSRARLSRLFARQLGISLQDYRSQQRLDRFHAAIENGPEVNLLTAALNAGFGSYSQCHRVFQQRFACGPREWLAARGR